jgi:hypothetical protein
MHAPWRRRRVPSPSHVPQECGLRLVSEECRLVLGGSHLACQALRLLVPARDLERVPGLVRLPPSPLPEETHLR